MACCERQRSSRDQQQMQAPPAPPCPSEWDIVVALHSYDSSDIEACVHMYANNRVCVLDTDTVAEVKHKIAEQLSHLLVEGAAFALTDGCWIGSILDDDCALLHTSIRDGSVVELHAAT